MSVIVESFRNYRYNTGRISLGLEGSSIVAEAHLDGEEGRRDLVIALHDLEK